MITADQLADISDLVGGQKLDEGILPSLRARFPDIHFSFAMDDDVMASRPVLRRSDFNLYLVDSADYCLVLTGDATTATGILVAAVEDI